MQHPSTGRSVQPHTRTCRPTLTVQPAVAISEKRLELPRSHSRPRGESRRPSRTVVPPASWRTPRSTSAVDAPTCVTATTATRHDNKVCITTIRSWFLPECAVGQHQRQVQALPNTPPHHPHRPAPTSTRPTSASFSVRRVRPRLMPAACSGPTTQLYSPLSVGDSCRVVTNCTGGERDGVWVEWSEWAALGDTAWKRKEVRGNEACHRPHLQPQARLGLPAGDEGATALGAQRHGVLHREQALQADGAVELQARLVGKGALVARQEAAAAHVLAEAHHAWKPGWVDGCGWGRRKKFVQPG